MKKKRDDGALLLLALLLLVAHKREKGSGVLIDVTRTDTGAKKGRAAGTSAHGESHDTDEPASHP